MTTIKRIESRVAALQVAAARLPVDREAEREAIEIGFRTEREVAKVMNALLAAARGVAREDEERDSKRKST